MAQVDGGDIIVQQVTLPMDVSSTVAAEGQLCGMQMQYFLLNIVWQSSCCFRDYSLHVHRLIGAPINCLERSNARVLLWAMVIILIQTNQLEMFRSTYCSCPVAPPAVKLRAVNVICVKSVDLNGAIERGGLEYSNTRILASWRSSMLSGTSLFLSVGKRKEYK
ncbi:hypothetical protein EAF00_004322 [Botryotinia globosa]|nr:hypothetical protein EAF00_004322 [Botryotinia globosa]